MELNEQTASHFARIALGHVSREYPNKLDHVMVGDTDARTPRDLHPVFFGSFDWHSCVHSWWMLLTLRRLFPGMPEAKLIEDLAEASFTEEKLATELAYLERPRSRGFERPYGWGWFLYLHHEAMRHEDRKWGAHLEPMAGAIAGRFGEYLPVLTYPITVGTHANTAFALTLACDWAKVRDPALFNQIMKWSIEAYENRSDYKGWEPGGDEFLSPVLIVAILMCRIMPRAQFQPWFDKLILENGWVERECLPVSVSDRTDGKIAHLDGLNLSRAWCLLEVANSIDDKVSSALLKERAELHLAASLPHVAGDYMGEHWLASFGLLALLSTD